MLYVVTGLSRSGTSMMMKSLEVGGLDAAYDERPQKSYDRHIQPGYHPNIVGWMQLFPHRLKETGFPNMYDGQLIKIPFHTLGKIAHCPNGIRVVVMRRDFLEIVESMAMLGMMVKQEHLDGFYDTVRHFHGRADVVDYHEFWYHDVLEDPLKHFKVLEEHGWEIDPEKCATIPSKEHRHINLKEDK